MRRVAALALSAFVLAGCGTPRNLSGVDTAASRTVTLTKSATSEEDRQKLEAELNDTLKFCQPKLSGFEEDSAKKARHAYWLSMSGLIAGSVIAPALTAAAPAANAAWTSALSGWGGATNFAGQALRTSGLSGTTVAQTRNDIIKNVKDQIRIATDGTKTFEQRRDAIMMARTECTLYQIAVPTIPDGQ